MTKNFIELKGRTWILKVHRVLNWGRLTQDKKIVMLGASQRSLRRLNTGENFEFTFRKKKKKKEQIMYKYKNYIDIRFLMRKE